MTRALGLERRLTNASIGGSRDYHEKRGKARARSLSRELRELGLNEAYVAIYAERIVASGTSEEQVQQILTEIMPAGKETHPYIYHFNP